MPDRPSRQTVADDWRTRLTRVVDTMREMSRQTNPEEMVRAYSARMREMLHTDDTISLSRRGLTLPRYRITRSSRWTDRVNPWKDRDRLPLLAGGLLSELIYGDEPRIINDLEVRPADPAHAYLEGHRSLMALPLFDQGSALNMVVLLRSEPGAFDPEDLPERVWMSNLFGRATHNLVLSEQLQEAYALVDHELQVVADIQRFLLPRELPAIPTMSLAAHYQTSRQAGGDYYDFFPLPDDRWGILIADVAGHGTPAAVVMAITHSIAHTYPGPPCPPGRMLEHVNTHLTARYTGDSGTFVTAFYGIYDPSTRELTYACAGHPPPRVKRCDDGTIMSIACPTEIPLGILPDVRYGEATHRLRPGDQVVFFTDGITEAMNPMSELFGMERLDEALDRCRQRPGDLIEAILEAVESFTEGRAPTDDRTVLLAKIT